MNSLKQHILLFIFAGCFTACGSHKKLASSTERKDNSPESTEVSTNTIQSKYSTLLHVEKNAIQQINLYRLIDEWYSTPYKYGGCDKSGVDCSNFTSILYQEIYKKTIKGSSSSIYNQCVPVSKTELQEGDLVFFKIGKQTVSHIGIYLQNNKFVHATTQRGVIISDLNEPYYLRYFYAGGRLK